MQLKKVVLRAPLGPMTLTMAPGSMVKSSLLTATRPPNRLVAPTASSSAIALRFLRFEVGDDRPGRRAGRGNVLRHVQLALDRARRQQALWSEAHDRDQGDAVEQQAVLGELAE